MLSWRSHLGARYRSNDMDVSSKFRLRFQLDRVGLAVICSFGWGYIILSPQRMQRQSDLPYPASGCLGSQAAPDLTLKRTLRCDSDQAPTSIRLIPASSTPHSTHNMAAPPKPPSHPPLNVLIVGAGIGGLSAAVSLRKQGHIVNAS
jgi:hypothetical protein